jgi:acyl-coenzyme A thioesterase PaaI-like protein
MLEKQAARRRAQDTATGLAQTMRCFMAQVDSENTTTTPVDPTRRHLLTIAAGGAVAAAIPTAVLAAASAVRS